MEKRFLDSQINVASFNQTTMNYDSVKLHAAIFMPNHKNKIHLSSRDLISRGAWRDSWSEVNNNSILVLSNFRLLRLTLLTFVSCLSIAFID